MGNTNGQPFDGDMNMRTFNFFIDCPKGTSLGQPYVLHNSDSVLLNCLIIYLHDQSLLITEVMDCQKER